MVQRQRRSCVSIAGNVQSLTREKRRQAFKQISPLAHAALRKPCVAVQNYLRIDHYESVCSVTNECAFCAPILSSS